MRASHGGDGRAPGGSWTRATARLRRGATRLGRRVGQVRLLTAAAVLSATAALVATGWPADRPTLGDPSVGQVVRVGVRQGDSIPDYLAASRAELDALRAAAPSTGPAQTYALVTLSAYLRPAQLPGVLRGASLTAVYARVPVPGVQTQIVRIPAIRAPDDVSAGMIEVAARKDREVADYRRRAARVVGSGAEQQRQREVLDSGMAVAAAEADAYRGACACVYAAVVRAPAAILDDVAARPQVRAVDAAPEVHRLDRAVFLPPLPEQVDVVRPPADDRLPADRATATPTPGKGARPRSS